LASIKYWKKINIYVVALLYEISLGCRMRGNGTFCLSDSEFQTGGLKIISMKNNYIYIYIFVGYDYVQRDFF